MRVITEFIHPPIPDRSHDWRATRDGYEPGDKMGYGRTERQAVADLLAESGCRDHGGDVETDGGCLLCNAEAGEACRARVVK
jgi:hypothetical protein